jgi:phosphatidyl-myo-inositol alpha-mannosyltransferase
VNRLEPRKGFRVAVQAFQLVLARIPDALLVVAGDGSERRAVATVPAAVRDRIVMLGTMSNTELPPYHAACEVFVAPATGRESFGIVLVEALAAGLPVAGSDIAGYREVVRDGIEGLLSRPRDPGAMATNVTTLLTEPRLYERLQRNARKRAQRFRWERVVAEVEEVYREAVAVGRS